MIGTIGTLILLHTISLFLYPFSGETPDVLALNTSFHSISVCWPDHLGLLLENL